MTLVNKDTGEPGFVVTTLGQMALDDCVTCECRWSVAGRLVLCAECGTVRGIIQEAGYSRPRWKKGD